MPHILVSAAHKSSGKTTITMGLCAALDKQGLRVQAFKKGPDYIDPMWLAKATGRSCYNLDYHTMGKDELRGTFRRYMQNADIGIIEGNKGLYDGLDVEGRNSNAALARLLKAPVVLVLDARGMTRGIAPLILGYQAFDRRLNIAGVILNKLGGKRHEGKLRAVIEHYTDVPVIGAVHQSHELNIDERHLGLIPSNEQTSAHDTIAKIAQIVGDQVDLERVRDIANSSVVDSSSGKYVKLVANSQQDIRIAVARDSAFGFYYPDDIEALEAAGAIIIPFDTLRDPELPQADALFIGGGFPETHTARLENNLSLRRSIKQAIENGMPTYAECGGLMYLSRSVTWKGNRREMVGALPADTIMHDKPQGRGYVRLKETQHALWPINGLNGQRIEFCAHEFHYSGLENVSSEIRFAYEVRRGHGIDGQHDGLIYKNVLASYTHLRDVSHNRWAKRFVDFVRANKQNQKQIPTIKIQGA